MNKEKITKDQIRNDLKNIRYYYMYEKEIEEAKQYCCVNFAGKVQLYNQMISFVPLYLNQIYYNLYILGLTQESLSEKSCYSLEYISRLNSKLVDFFIP